MTFDEHITSRYEHRLPWSHTVRWNIDETGMRRYILFELFEASVSADDDGCYIILPPDPSAIILSGWSDGLCLHMTVDGGDLHLCDHEGTQEFADMIVHLHRRAAALIKDGPPKG